MACACASASIACSIVMPIPAAAWSWSCRGQRSGPRPVARAVACALASRSSLVVQGVEEAPGQAFLRRHRAAGEQQLAGAALADHARQQGAGAHVGTGQADAREQEGGLRGLRCRSACRRPAPSWRRRRRRCRRWRRCTGCGQLRMVLTRSPVMRVNSSISGMVILVSGPMISCTSPPEQKLPPAPVTTTALTSVAAQGVEQVAQLGIGLEGQRVLALGPVERDGAHAAVKGPGEMSRLVAGLRRRTAAHGVARADVVFHGCLRELCWLCCLTLPSSRCRVSISRSPRAAKASTIQSSCGMAMSANCSRPCGVRRTR